MVDVEFIFIYEKNNRFRIPILFDVCWKWFKMIGFSKIRKGDIFKT